MNYYNEIKNKFIDHEGYKKIKDYSKNRNELNTYYEVGKLLVEAQGGETRAKYGNGLIREYSKRLTLKLGKGYDSTTLKRMRKLYIVIEKGAALRHQLTWSHYRELLILNDSNQINYYIKITLELGKGYGITNLKNMRSFYIIRKGQALPDQLTWSHYCELLAVKDMHKMDYYINICIRDNLSYRELKYRIKSKEYLS